MAQNWLLISLRVLSVGLLVFMLVQLSAIYDPQVYNVANILTIIGSLRDIFAYVLYIVLFAVFFGLFTIFGFGLTFIPSAFFDKSYFDNLTAVIFQNLVGRWFKFTDDVQTVAPTMQEAIAGLQALFASITQDVYMVVLQVIVLAAFLFALKGALTSDPDASIKVIVLINIVIIIPMFFRQLDVVIRSFVPSIVYPPAIQQILDANLLVISEIFVDVSGMGLGAFILSKVFIVAVFMFLYLEFVFQMAYVEKVTMPSIEREERLSRQIEVMHEEAQKAIARIKAMEEKKREEKERKRLEMTEEEKKAEKEAQDKISLRSFMAESDKSDVGFSYVAELIKRKKEEKKEKKMMDAMSDTRKVANYLDKLFKQDPEARNTLTAKTSAPKSSRLILSTLSNMFFRIAIVSVIAWAAVHPFKVFEILQAPDSILNSVELQTFEGVWSLIIPFLLIIPLISSIIKMAKHNKLEEILRQEELRRAGMTEEEMEALNAQRSQVGESVDFSRDQDALADQAKKAAQAAQYGQNP